jgi:hypothetical protein
MQDSSTNPEADPFDDSGAEHSVRSNQLVSGCVALQKIAPAPETEHRCNPTMRLVDQERVSADGKILQLHRMFDHMTPHGNKPKATQYYSQRPAETEGGVLAPC